MKEHLLNKVHCLDALELMRQLPDASVDMFFSDLPYGVHEADWDNPPPLDPLWVEIKRVIKPRHAVVLTAVMRFAVELINTSGGWFKYDWVANKTIATDFLNAKNKPLRSHEHVLVFSDGTTANKSPNRMVYYPQTQPGNAWGKKHYATETNKDVYGRSKRKAFQTDQFRSGGLLRFPQTSLVWGINNNGSLHPNQKPLDAWMYLIRTYTQPGDIILDPFVGSGTTALAAAILGRRFIVGDTSSEYCAIARKRLEAYTPDMFEVMR